MHCACSAVRLHPLFLAGWAEANMDDVVARLDTDDDRGTLVTPNA